MHQLGWRVRSWVCGRGTRVCACVFMREGIRVCVCAMRARVDAYVCIHASCSVNTLHAHIPQLRVCRPQTDKMISAKFSLQVSWGQNQWTFKGYSGAGCSGSSSTSSSSSSCIGSSSKGYVSASAGTAPPTPPTPVSQRDANAQMHECDGMLRLTVNFHAAMSSYRCRQPRQKGT